MIRVLPIIPLVAARKWAPILHDMVCGSNVPRETKTEATNSSVLMIELPTILVRHNIRSDMSRSVILQ